jgi:hypothetical protein
MRLSITESMLLGTHAPLPREKAVSEWDQQRRVPQPAENSVRLRGPFEGWLDGRLLCRAKRQALRTVSGAGAPVW